MSWHEGHDVRMMVETPIGERTRLGPWCVDCDETAFYIVVPSEGDMAKAHQWVQENRPEWLCVHGYYEAHCSHGVEPGKTLRCDSPCEPGDWRRAIGVLPIPEDGLSPEEAIRRGRE